MRFTLKELALIINCKCLGKEDKYISGINTLEDANGDEISFFSNPRYIERFKSSKAGIICINKSLDLDLNSDKNYLICDDPSASFQKIADFFLNKQKLSGFENIHKSAVIHKSAKIAKNVKIGPNTTIDQDVQINENCYIFGNVYIARNVKIGTDCIIYPNVTIREDVIIKNRVIIQPGAVIGSCGFGYAFENNKYVKLNQLGNVILEDDVEIGANATIDRARFKSTIIGKGTKIDNLVQVAHNVEIGQNCAIAALSGIAGSTKIGNHCIMGGQVGITGHVEIESNVMLATRSGVSKNLKAGKYRGSPAVILEEYNKQYVYIKNLKKTIESLSKRIESLENSLSKN